MAQKGDAQETTHSSHKEKAWSFIPSHLQEGLSAGVKGTKTATRQEEGGVSVSLTLGRPCREQSGSCPRQSGS